MNLRSPVCKIASTIKDNRGSEGSGGDARRTSYTLPPGSLSDSEQLGTMKLFKPARAAAHRELRVASDASERQAECVGIPRQAIELEERGAGVVVGPRRKETLSLFEAMTAQRSIANGGSATVRRERFVFGPLNRTSQRSRFAVRTVTRSNDRATRSVRGLSQGRSAWARASPATPLETARVERGAALAARLRAPGARARRGSRACQEWPRLAAAPGMLSSAA